MIADKQGSQGATGASADSKGGAKRGQGLVGILMLTFDEMVQLYYQNRNYTYISMF